jgi:hypothetical protein
MSVSVNNGLSKTEQLHCTSTLSLMVPIHHVQMFSANVVARAIALPIVSSASSNWKRSSLEPGRPSVGERLLSTTPTDASTSFCAPLSFLPYWWERGLMGFPRSS